MTRHVVVIGAGIGGLTAAALLLKSGFQVTVFEAHIYPGGSAGTFFHKGYRFDAGATLAGGFQAGGPHARVAELLDLDWPVKPVDPAWVVHLPGLSVTQWSDAQHWREERHAAFPGTEAFWQTQEKLANAAWDISTHPFPWPPGHLRDLPLLASALRLSSIRAAPFAFRSVAEMFPRVPADLFKVFIDAQLMISAQATSTQANALYGSAALDLPRRGVNQVHGGIGELAKTLAQWITAHGGQFYYRQKVVKIMVRNGHLSRVFTEKGMEMAADAVIANLTPAALASVLGDAAPPVLRREVNSQRPAWGAFTLYLGVDDAKLPDKITGHHQIILDPTRALGEGNSVFLSLSDPTDTSRAPKGQRTMTLSTHTAVQPWWLLANHDPQAYALRKEEYTRRVLTAAECAIPRLRSAVRLCLPGTPITFQYYTRRPLGLVGGTPQTSFLHARGPGSGIPNIHLVGDSIFPGQSTAGVTLGAIRVAQDVARYLSKKNIA